MAKPRKRHHIVPQFLLRRFTDDNGLLWLHDLESFKATRVQPKDALVETYLYAPGTGDNPTNDAFEVLIADHIEGPAVTPIDKLSKGDVLSDDDRYRVALFVAFQEIRVPRMRDLVGSFVSQIGEQVLQMAAQDPDYMKGAFAEMGKDISENTLSQIIEAIKSGGIKVNATKMAWLQSTRNAFEIAKMLYQMPWMIAVAPDGTEFLTSDAPIAKVLTNRNVPSQFAGGWISPSAESTFALDPKTCLVIRQDGQHGHVNAPKTWADDVNARLTAQCSRFVISRRRDEYVEDLARERATRRGSAEPPKG